MIERAWAQLWEDPVKKNTSCASSQTLFVTERVLLCKFSQSNEYSFRYNSAIFERFRESTEQRTHHVSAVCALYSASSYMVLHNKFNGQSVCRGLPSSINHTA